MKILVFAHQLVVGGTPLNAIELAAALRDGHGHEVVLFAAPGPMVKLVEQKGLRLLPAPEARIHPSPTRMRALREAVRLVRPDVIHAWDWFQCIDAYYVEHLLMRVPMVVTDMMNVNVTRLLPKALPTTFGTREIVDKARMEGRQRVEFIPPPVDIHLNAPDAADGQRFRQSYGIGQSDIALVTVSRLARELKSESLFRTVNVVRTLARDLPLRLVIVGDGEARAELQRMADEANAELGRRVVVLSGELSDPRYAYAAADIVVGMGGSALRGMAFSKPVIIVGKNGFSACFTPETAEFFHQKGFYGIGDGSPSNARLAADIRELAEQPEKLRALGEFSRQFVLRHFSLETVSARLAKFLVGAANEAPMLFPSVVDGLRTAVVYLRERKFMVRSLDPGQNRNMDVGRESAE